MGYLCEDVYQGMTFSRAEKGLFKYRALAPARSGPRRRSSLVRGISLVAILIAGSFGMAAASSPHSSSVYRWATPAGYDIVALKPAGAVISLLGLIECAELEGAQQVDEGVKARIIAADGRAITHFPRNFSFRITASLRKTLLTEATTELNSSHDPHDFLLKLKFSLKVYDGMEMRVIEPESVQMIGVPDDIPYDERVYRINFSLEQIPVTDRLVLEVQSPEGERLTRFHFGLL